MEVYFVKKMISHTLSHLFSGDDDSVPAVALERDLEGSEGGAVLSTGKNPTKQQIIKRLFYKCYVVRTLDALSANPQS